MEIEFVVWGVPVAQPRSKAVSIGGHARIYNPKTADAFKAAVGAAFIAQYPDVAPLDCPIAVDVAFVMPRPKTMVWKTRPMPRIEHTKRPDIDNLLKSLFDALNGLAWRDDTQVCHLTAHKMIAAGDERPHVHVRIYDVGKE